MKDKVIITHYSNITKEGIVLHLNIPARLKTGTLTSKEFYVSWDKIGESLFEDYAKLDSVDEYRKLRGDLPPSEEKKEIKPTIEDKDDRCECGGYFPTGDFTFCSRCNKKTAYTD